MRKELNSLGTVFEKYSYEQIQNYFEADSKYKDMVTAQAKHNMSAGTEQLRFMDGRRLPGLPYFVEMARQEMREQKQELEADKVMLRGCKLMQESWTSFAPAVHQSQTSILNHEDRTFKPSRTWDYFNLNAYEATLERLDQVLHQPKSEEVGIASIISVYGSECGIGDPYPGRTAEDHKLEVQTRYGVDRFEPVMYKASADSETAADVSAGSSGYVSAASSGLVSPASEAQQEPVAGQHIINQDDGLGSFTQARGKADGNSVPHTPRGEKPPIASKPAWQPPSAQSAASSQDAEFDQFARERSSIGALGREGAQPWFTDQAKELEKVLQKRLKTEPKPRKK